MTAGQEGNQNLPDDTVLADDRLAQLSLQPRGHLGNALERERLADRPLRHVQIALGHSTEVYHAPFAVRGSRFVESGEMIRVLGIGSGIGDAGS